MQECDLNEYNQCQTQLKELYRNNRTSTGRSQLVNKPDFWEHQEEFIAYRILYYVYLSTNEKYSGGSSDINHIMSSLTSTERIHPAIRHALQVREAVAFSDYFWFFRLHKNSPNLGNFLTDLLVPNMRMRSLRRIAKAYRPSIEVNVCLQQLGFHDNDDCVKGDGEKTGWGGSVKLCSKVGKSWLISCGVNIDGSKVITKDSEIHAPNTKTNSLI